MSFARNSAWSIVQTVMTQAIAMAGNIALAKLLSPEQFGLLGMATIFTGLILVVQEVGMGSYLVYKQNTDEAFLPTVHWMNLMISVILSALLFGIAGPLSVFYHAADIRTIVTYIAIGVLLGSLGITARALNQKNMRYKNLAVIDMGSEALSGGIAIAFAVNGYPLLAITSKFLFRPALQSIFLLTGADRKQLFGRRFDVSIFAGMLKYSSSIILSQILIYASSVADFLLIGKTMGSKQLGLYAMAFNWAFLVRNAVSGAVARVVFSDLSRIQNDLPSVRTKYQALMRTLSFFLFPLCVGLSLLSHDFVMTLYGERWISSATIMQYLMIAGLLSSLGTTSGALFKSLGRPDYDLKLFSAMFPLVFVLMYAGTQYGIRGVCIAVVIENLIVLGIRSYLVVKLLVLEWKTFIFCFLPSAASAIGMGFGYGLASMAITDGVPILAVLIIKVIVLIAAYLGSSRLANKAGYDQLAALVNTFIRRNARTKDTAKAGV